MESQAMKPGFFCYWGGSTGLQVIQWEEFDLHGVRIRETAGPLDFRWGRGITTSSTLRISKLRRLRPQAFNPFVFFI